MISLPFRPGSSFVVQLPPMPHPVLALLYSSGVLLYILKELLQWLDYHPSVSKQTSLVWVSQGVGEHRAIWPRLSVCFASLLMEKGKMSVAAWFLEPLYPHRPGIH